MHIRRDRCATFLKALVLAVSVNTSALPQSLADSPIIFRSGQWDVHRVTDAMKDAALCIGIYKGRFDIQLGENALTIALADGVKNVQLRFDDEDPKPSRPASTSEWKKSAVAISGSDFTELLDSARLRYQVQTAANTTVWGDINLDGVFLVHGNIAAGCAGNPVATPPRAVAADTCTQPMRDRMGQKGLSVQDINDICSKPQ
jgi:hypothetical protein